MYALADVIAAAKTAGHLQFFKGSAKEFRGMFRQQAIRDWSHAAHFGWARLLDDRGETSLPDAPHHTSMKKRSSMPTISTRTGSSLLLATSALSALLPPLNFPSIC